MLKRNLIKVGLLLLLVVVILYPLFDAHGGDVQVIVEPKPEYKETVYRIISLDEKELTLTTHQSELNKEVLHFRSTSSLSFMEQVDLFSILLAEVFKRENKEQFKTLFIGRLMRTFGESNTQMAERLALAAHASPIWSTQNGKPVSGHGNSAIQTMANEDSIYSELAGVFSSHGLSIRISDVEKVLIGHPGDIPFGEHLIKKGVGNKDKVPFDCLTWFSISSKGLVPGRE